MVLLQKANGDNTVHDYTIPATPVYKGKDGVFSSMIKKLDDDYSEQRDELIFLTSQGVFDDYADEIGAIPTAMGSQVLSYRPIDGLPYKGIKILP